MITSVSSIEIDQRIDRVFEYTNSNVAEWSMTVLEEEVLEDVNGGGVGTKFRCLTENQGHKLELQGVVVEYDSPNRSAVEMVSPQFNIRAEYDFEELSGGRTRVTQTSHVRPNGFGMKMFFTFFGWLMKRGSCNAQEKELASLKQHAELKA